jgi:hypothetical protein
MKADRVIGSAGGLLDPFDFTSGNASKCGKTRENGSKKGHFPTDVLSLAPVFSYT